MIVPKVFWVATVLVGALVGFLVGASKSPLSSAALPIFASLLTASVTFFLTVKPGKLPPAQFYRPVAIGYLWLLAGFVPALFLGIVLRIGSAEYLALGPLLVDWGPRDPFRDLKNYPEQRDYALVSAHLTALGLDETHKRVVLKDLVAAERLENPSGDALPASDWPEGASAKRVEASLLKFAACVSAQDPRQKPLSQTAYEMRRSVSLISALQPPAPAAPTIPPVACKLACQIDALRSNVAAWSAPQNLSLAEGCGLSPEERLELEQVAATLLSSSPLFKAANDLAQQGENFHRAWGSISGRFTAGSADDSVAAPPVQETSKELGK